jgi:hypothetical protein
MENTTPRPVFIYALLDLDARAIRYIGKSVDPIRRLSTHLRTDGEQHCSRWLQKLRRANRKPQLVIIEQADETTCDARERFWIARGRAKEWPLTNETDGGEGMLGYRHTEPELIKMSLSQHGRIFSPETRARMSEAKRNSGAVKEHLRSIAGNWRGKTFSAEHKAKISVALSGRKFSSEHIVNLSKAHRALAATDKGRDRLSAFAKAGRLAKKAKATTK